MNCGAVNNSNKSWIDELTLSGIRVRRDMSAKDLTTMKVGGPLECLCEVQNLVELQDLLRRLAALGQSFRVLGAGSNVCVNDGGLPGVTIKLGRGFKSKEILAQGEIVVGAAYALMRFSQELSEQGFSGLEFAGGIPATIGGAVFMNAGAHGAEICGVLQNVDLVLSDGSFVKLPAKELNFSYRHSELPNSAIVVGATFRLLPGDRAETWALRSRFLEERKAKQPLSSPSSGSVFKNPSEKAAGALIEASGLKGYSHGGAKFSDLHANWIVNEDRKASFEDVKTLVDLAKSRVKEKFLIDLHEEIRFW